MNRNLNIKYSKKFIVKKLGLSKKFKKKKKSFFRAKFFQGLQIKIKVSVYASAANNFN